MVSESILGRAIEAGHLEVELIDIREYATNKHKNTDDYPFGGGAGMVMLAQPIVDAFEANTSEGFKGRRIYMSPRGRRLDQKIVEELAQYDELMILCGHYEGVDRRIIDEIVDEEISIGDYVLTGGEIPACIVVDAVARLVDGVLADAECHEKESISSGMLEYPQYTRPYEFHGVKVPEVLISGHHENIDRWRHQEALRLTQENRPDVLEKFGKEK